MAEISKQLSFYPVLVIQTVKNLLFRTWNHSHCSFHSEYLVTKDFHFKDMTTVDEKQPCYISNVFFVERTEYRQFCWYNKSP